MLAGRRAGVRPCPDLCTAHRTPWPPRRANPIGAAGAGGAIGAVQPAACTLAANVVAPIFYAVAGRAGRTGIRVHGGSAMSSIVCLKRRDLILGATAALLTPPALAAEGGRLVVTPGQTEGPFYPV